MTKAFMTEGSGGAFRSIPPWQHLFQRAASRVQLWKLSLGPKVRPAKRSDESEFVLFGWVWHHLAIRRDLARLSDVMRSRVDTLCPAEETQAMNEQSLNHRKGVVRALEYILEGWAVHNKVERKILFPWLASRKEDSVTPLAVIETERERLEEDSNRLLRGMRFWSQTDQVCSQRCRRDVHTFSSSLKELAADSSSLFRISEVSLMPLVEEIKADEQRALNRKIITRIGPRAVRLQIVTFQDAIFGGGKHSVSTVQDKANFKREIPGPVKAMLPMWRREFLKPVIPYLDP